ncbi:MAG: HEAT repeat domain-containing protein [Candidatus Heimdallarchaeum endolithica]|uniref:HEAT repeat domain-containing protein n=1 Tax=Candidatus Heimdallarchaeum endolithica TaxID=2876572 RepID=A0A9Y1BTR8_9ARCH|nr:MAG: HEAT repeat domain-containing protein [Candidatus Heimdallarchaeum endolithica]
MVEIREDDINALIASLHEKDDAVKIYTLGIIADNSKRDQAIDEVIAFLSYPNEDVRAQAAKTLGKIGSRKAIDSLVISLHDSAEEVRLYAITALGRIEAYEAIPFIEPSLKDDSSKVRNEAALILDFLGWKPETLEGELLFYIARFKWDEIIELEKVDEDLLLQFLYDADCEVVKGVAETLGKMKVEKAIQPLFDLFMSADNKDLQVSLSQAIALIGGEKALDLLLVASIDENWFIRKCAVDALGEMKNLLALNPLFDMMKDDNLYVRKSVMKAIQKIRDSVRRNVPEN